MVPREGFQIELVYGAHQVLTCLSLPDSDPTRDSILLFVQVDRPPARKVVTHEHRADDHLGLSHRSTRDHLTVDNVEPLGINRQNFRPGSLSDGLCRYLISTTKPIYGLLGKFHHLRSAPSIRGGGDLSGECPWMNTLESSSPVICGMCFKRSNSTRDRGELDGDRRVSVVHRFDIVEEHGKGYPVVEGVMKNDNKVVFVRRHVTEVDWGMVKCVLCTKIKTVDEFLRRVVDGFPLLSTPLEVESGMHDLSPTTEFN